MTRQLFTAAAFVVAAFSASAQSQFGLNLTGDAVTPPVVASGGGYAFVSLNSDSTVNFSITTWKLKGTSASIRLGNASQSAPLICSLTGGPSSWSGTAGPLSQSDCSAIQAGQTFLLIQTAAHPNGELGGQIVPNPLTFGTTLSGDQVVPPTLSGAHGTGTFTLTASGRVDYSVTTKNIVGTAAHVYLGNRGENGTLLEDLKGGPTDWSGTSNYLTTSEMSVLQTQGVYVVVDSAAFPDGEIRGQLIPMQVPFGVGWSDNTKKPSMTLTGTPVEGCDVTVTIAGGLPNGTGLVAVGSLSDGIPVGNMVFLLGGSLTFIPVALNSLGGLSDSDTVPDLDSSFDIYLQFVGFEPTSTRTQLYASNAIKVSLINP